MKTPTDDRLRQIVNLLKQKHNKTNIAVKMGTTVKALESCLDRAYVKHGVRSLTALMTALDATAPTLHGGAVQEGGVREAQSECVCCGSIQGLRLVEPIGGFKPVPMCGPCLDRLRQVRQEAYHRHYEEVAHHMAAA